MLVMKFMGFVDV